MVTDSKYSAASDVWAFGVFVFEVVSQGQEPLSEFETARDVAEAIKNGFKMECPANCPAVIHKRAMLPCWNAEPSVRPTFHHLKEVLENLGATPAQGEEFRQRSSRTSSNGNLSDVQWRDDLEDRSLLGPSIHHIANVLVPRVADAVSRTWCDRNGVEAGPLGDPTDARIFHAVDATMKPAGATTTCPRDGELGCAYVDTLTQRDDVGRANALLSYSWGYRIGSVANALGEWATASNRPLNGTYIWVCSMCLNQHRFGDDKATPDELEAEFGSRVLAIGRILPMLEPYVPIALSGSRLPGVPIHVCCACAVGGVIRRTSSGRGACTSCTPQSTAVRSKST